MEHLAKDDLSYEVNRNSEAEARQSTSKNPSSSSQMRKGLKLFAQTCDRFQIPDRAASTLSSALLRDLEIVSPEKTQMLIDKSKVRRERFKQRRALQSSDCALASKSMQGLYFDSRKDKTLIQVTELDGKRHQRTIREENISIVSEPESKYFDHVTPGSGKAKDIASEILSLLNKRSVDTKQIVAIGCDSTAVNTGIKGGVVRLLEKLFKKPIQWFICLLHINELPLRHEHYSGLLHWERNHQRTELPMTMAISKEQLCACIRDEKKLDKKLFDFPYHTQAVERCIKLVTEASCKVYGKNS